MEERQKLDGFLRPMVMEIQHLNANPRTVVDANNTTIVYRTKMTMNIADHMARCKLNCQMTPRALSGCPYCWIVGETVCGRTVFQHSPLSDVPRPKTHDELSLWATELVELRKGPDTGSAERLGQTYGLTGKTPLFDLASQGYDSHKDSGIDLMHLVINVGGRVPELLQGQRALLAKYKLEDTNLPMNRTSVIRGLLDSWKLEESVILQIDRGFKELTFPPGFIDQRVCPMQDHGQFNAADHMLFIESYGPWLLYDALSHKPEVRDVLMQLYALLRKLLRRTWPKEEDPVNVQALQNEVRTQNHVQLHFV
jgi:hypothetical protein